MLSPEGNTAKLNIRGSVNYTGMKKDRVRSKNADGNLINSAYYGKDNIIEEFMNACKGTCLQQQATLFLLLYVN